MPTYHARGVTTRLGVSSLADTVTPNIVLRKGDIVRKQCEQAEQQLRGSRFLGEKRVDFPVDEPNFELHWLAGAPFMQIEVGWDLFPRHDEEESAQHPNTTMDSASARPPPAKYGTYETGDDPLALSLHVITSERTFISGLDKSNKLHIKIEVFVNGRLSNCLFFPPYEYRSGAKAFHQVFGGHRVDFLAERPWVILPPNTAADGSQRNATSSSSVDDRWEEICKALSTEADHRGSNRSSGVPPTAELLKALAAMAMPHEVRTMQSPGGRKLGIIDVIITAGNGRKVTSGAAYLKAPQRFDDENFPLRSTAESSAYADTTVRTDRRQAEARDAFISISDHQDLRTEAQIEADAEPQLKRRAVKLGGLPNNSNRPDARRSQTQKPRSIMPTPFPHSPSKKALGEIQAPTTPDVPSRANSLESRFDPIPSPEHGRVSQSELAHQATGSTYTGSLYDTPQSFPSFPGSSVTRAHTPQMQPSPYSYQFPESIPSHYSPGAFFPVKAFDFSDAPSSPLHRMQSKANSPHPQLFPHSYALGSDRFSTHVIPSPAFPPLVVIEAPRRNSMGTSPMALSSPATSQVWPGDELYSQLSPSNQSADIVPNMLPPCELTKHSNPTPLRVAPFSSPFDRRFSMPLPPTGFFSVPAKPKPSLSPRKQVQPRNETTLRGLLVRRLLITGKNGVMVVDHTWPVAQQIHERGQTVPSMVSGPATSKVDPTLGSGALKARRTRELVPRMPLTLVKDAPQGCESDIKPSSGAIEGHDVRSKMEGGPVGSRDNQGTGVPEQQMMSDTARAAYGNTSLPMALSIERSVSKPVVPQRRIPSGPSILGVQGPKATTFWFDNPEQLIREAAKERRTKSLRKPKDGTSIGPGAAATQDAAISFTPAAASSSPLSSMHTSSDLDGSTENDIDQADLQIPSTLEANIPPPQIDGSCELTKPISVPKTSPTKPKSSPTKSSSKKRKASTTSTPSVYLEKQPRSPDRLKTINNPPLNQDCVIALAESEDKSAKRGVLRQVKGERQGVFAEEYVVFASRYYIPGN